MRVLITGATGFVGSQLVARLRREGHECVILTRDVAAAEKKLGQGKDRFVAWDARSPLPEDVFENIDAAVNLVGESIAAKRWSPAQKQRIIDSRINATRALVAGLKKRGTTLISASAIGFYPVNRPEALDESASPGEGFMPEICQRWEAETDSLAEGVRKVILRIGVVVGRQGGMMQKLLPVFRLGAGGPVGNGQQMMSWIHVDDLVGIIMHALSHEEMSGVYNAVAPQPVTNREFSKQLGQALKRPAFFAAPAFAMRLAMGEMADVVLDAQNISATKVRDEAGYQFQYPDMRSALAEVVSA